MSSLTLAAIIVSSFCLGMITWAVVSWIAGKYGGNIDD